ncbi:protein kinase [Chloracidobacterium validum]|uniref:Protein kinase n=1 Tax=Chloracidobacterium validum TaxID=2821543 RepID=A0ABX8B8K9_9BACT|nr:serine/threonine-protein kinase [Chloracidobacterium validum]QUW03279.1 protein kinase [Chloracidobacterium validum]
MRDASVSSGASSVPPALLAGLTMHLPLNMAPEPSPVSPSQSDPFVGRTLDGKYSIERRIGRGGSGAVYRARHLLIHRTVAVKVLSRDLVADEDALARFRREAAMAGRLKHLNIVSVMDFGITPDGVAYLVMDFIEGKSLRRILDQQGRVALEKLVRWMKPICSAVHAAHRKGIIHRDLKPDNVMIEVVDDEEIPRVLDFGIAKLADAVAVSSDFNTETGSVMGTPHYMSPEQCEGKPLDPRSDIYSLGTLAYELLTGNVPFPGKVTTTVMMQQVTATPRPLRDLRPDLPEAVELCVMRALSKNPAKRQATALDLALELETALASLAFELPSAAPDAWRPEASIARVTGDFRAQLREAAAVAPPLPVVRSAPSVKVLPPTPVAQEDAVMVHEGRECLAVAEQRAATVKLPGAHPSPASAEVADDQPLPSFQVLPSLQTADALPSEGDAVGTALPSDKPLGRRLATPPLEAPPPTEQKARPSSPALSADRVRLRHATSPVDSRPMPHRVWSERVAWSALGRWGRLAVGLMGIVLVSYALVIYGLYRQANTALSHRLATLAQDRQQPLATLRDRALDLCAALKLQTERIRVRLDPPNQKVTLQVHYRRSILGIPLHFQSEVVASRPMTLDMLAGVAPTQAELVNVSARELDRYRAEQAAAGRR